MASETRPGASIGNADVQPQQESKFRNQVPVWNGARGNMTLLCAGILLLPLPYLKYLGALLVLIACIRNRKDYTSFLGRKGIARLVSIGLAVSVLAIFIIHYAILLSGQAFSNTFLATELNGWYRTGILGSFYLILTLASLIAVLCFPYVLFYTEKNRVLWIVAICVSLLSVVTVIFLYMQSEFEAIFHLLVYGQISSVQAVTRMVSLFSYVTMLFEIPYGILLYNLLKGVYRAAYESESF